MKKIKIFSGNWTVNDVTNQKTDTFVYGDNLLRKGKGGQAIIRDLPNTIGLVTKKEPNNNSSSFFSDIEYEKNYQFILNDILKIKRKQILGDQLVFSSGGYGTGLSKLPELSPKTFDILNTLLLNFFHYDNLSGKLRTEVPSSNQIINGSYISLDKINKPLSNSEFNSESLSNDIYNIYDLIRKEYKISFISDDKFKTDDIVIFYDNNKDYLICRVIHNSMLVKNINDVYRFEGYNCSDVKGEYITFFEFISTLNPESGKMIYNERFFNFGNSTTKNVIEDDNLKEDKSLEEKVNNLEKKVDLLFEFLKGKLG